MTGHQSIDGYVADDAYPSSFHRELTPAWIDAMLRHRGFAPPREGRGPFALLDLGCGDGLGLIALAAGWPEGEFVGVDALPAHIEHGEATARRLGIGNIRFVCARFADMEPPAGPGFDYVTGQGLLSWVTAANRAAIFDISRAQLRAGGVACFGYNTLPGWAAGLAFQRLVRTVAEAGEGSAADRFAAAAGLAKALSAAGAAALPRGFLGWIDGLRETLPAGYFAHEYLNRNWTPLWSADVIDDMADRGLGWRAHGRTERLRDDFCLTAAQRSAIDAIDDPAARGLAADIAVNSSFRIDIFGRDVEASNAPREARLGGWWAACVGEAEAAYRCRTPAGMIRFDNIAAHAILAGLADGPGTLAAIHAEDRTGTAADMLNAADALFVAGDIVPVDPPGDAPAAAAINAEILARTAAGARFEALVGAHGAVPVAKSAMHDEAGRDARGRLGIA